MGVVIERRTASPSKLAQKLAWPLRLSRAQAWRAVVFGGGLVAIADALTGREIWLGPMYFVIIGLAAWSLGWLQAIAVGLVNLAITLRVNGFELYPYSGAAGAWNIAMRIAAVVVLICLVHSVRQMYQREWLFSRTDPLTGALNRKAFFELTGARSNWRGWSLLLFADLDGFKQLNDRHGHAAGDECLVTFAREMMKAIRKGDLLARVGGDEFVIYLDVKNEAAGKLVAKRLHQAMNSVEMRSGSPLRCSLGALIIPPGLRSIDHEIRGADTLMYEAKGLGSSLVVGTLVGAGAASKVHRHWELSPEAQALTAACPSLPSGHVQGRRHLRTGARDLQQVA